MEYFTAAKSYFLEEAGSHRDPIETKRFPPGPLLACCPLEGLPPPPVPCVVPQESTPFKIIARVEFQ